MTTNNDACIRCGTRRTDVTVGLASATCGKLPSTTEHLFTPRLREGSVVRFRARKPGPRQRPKGQECFVSLYVQHLDGSETEVPMPDVVWAKMTVDGRGGYVTLYLALQGVEVDFDAVVGGPDGHASAEAETWKRQFEEMRKSDKESAESYEKEIADLRKQLDEKA